MRVVKYFLVFLFVLSSSNVFATTYFVKNDGDDSADGRSEATAWQTVKRVKNFVFKPGDDVYFKAGDVWDRQLLWIDWSGTETDPSVIGAYYVKDGVEVIGVPDGVSKPTLTGGYISSTSIGNYPSGIWTGLIESNGNYITIQNMRVQDSSGFGINVNKGFHHNIIENSEIDHVSGGLIFLNRGSHSNIVRKNKGWKCSWSEVDGIKPWPTHPGCIAGATSDNNIIEDNIIYSGSGEGIVVYQNSRNNVVRRNTVMAVAYPGLYLDNASNNIVERNILLGDYSGALGKGEGHYTKGGISITIENYGNVYDSTDNVVRNNIVAGVRYCLLTDVQSYGVEQGKKISFDYVGNTCVDTVNDVIMLDTANEYLSTLIANNIFWNQENLKSTCSAPTSTSVRFTNNSWQTTPPDKDCQSAGDLAGDPMLTGANIFAAITSTKNYDVNDFIPQGNSPLKSKGLTLSSLTNDFFDVARATPPSIGAIEGALIASQNEAPSAGVETPFFMNIGDYDQLLELTYSYVPENYRIDPSVESWRFYTGRTDKAILSTKDDEIYQSWRGCVQCSLSWNIPVETGYYDISLNFVEQYWGDEKGTCIGGERRFDILIEDALVDDEFDICATAKASNTAVVHTNYAVYVADGGLNIQLSPGSTGTLDNNPEIAGLGIVKVSPPSGKIRGKLGKR